jgi:hypothetical protein
MSSVVFLLIAANLYTDWSFGHVLEKLVHGSRLFGFEPDYALPGDNAICYRRYQLEAKPLVSLFHQICRPLATPDTPGAFLFGLRAVALKGSTEDVPNSPAILANIILSGVRLLSPPVQAVYLSESGTHAVIDAGFWPVHISERVSGFHLLRAVTSEMLVRWDRGFHDYEMFGRCDSVGRRYWHVYLSTFSLRLGRLYRTGLILPDCIAPTKKGGHWANIC